MEYDKAEAKYRFCSAGKIGNSGLKGKEKSSWPLTFVVVDFTFRIFSFDASLFHVQKGSSGTSVIMYAKNTQRAASVSVYPIF